MLKSNDEHTACKTKPYFFALGLGQKTSFKR